LRRPPNQRRLRRALAPHRRQAHAEVKMQQSPTCTFAEFQFQ
jgi:hypothetical protein